MAHRFTCPSCGSMLDVEPSMLGQVVACGACGGEMTLPAAAPPRRSSPPPSRRESRAPERVAVELEPATMALGAGVAAAGGIAYGLMYYGSRNLNAGLVVAGLIVALAAAATGLGMLVAGLLEAEDPLAAPLGGGWALLLGGHLLVAVCVYRQWVEHGSIQPVETTFTVVIALAWLGSAIYALVRRRWLGAWGTLAAVPCYVVAISALCLLIDERNPWNRLRQLVQQRGGGGGFAGPAFPIGQPDPAAVARATEERQARKDAIMAAANVAKTPDLKKWLTRAAEDFQLQLEDYELGGERGVPKPADDAEADAVLAPLWEFYWRDPVHARAVPALHAEWRPQGAIAKFRVLREERRAQWDRLRVHFQYAALRIPGREGIAFLVEETNGFGGAAERLLEKIGAPAEDAVIAAFEGAGGERRRTLRRLLERIATAKGQAVLAKEKEGELAQRAAVEKARTDERAQRDRESKEREEAQQRRDRPWREPFLKLAKEAADPDLQRKLQACADARGNDLPTAFVALNGAKAEAETGRRIVAALLLGERELHNLDLLSRVVETAAGFDPEGAVGLLETAFDQRRPGGRELRALLRVAEKMKHPKVPAVLARILQDRRGDEERKDVGFALMQLGPAAEEPLLPLLDLDDDKLRTTVIDVLARVGGEKSLAKIRELLKTLRHPNAQRYLNAASAAIKARLKEAAAPAK